MPRFQRSKIYIAVLCNIYVWFQHYHLAPPLAQLTCIFFKVRLVVLIYLVFSLFGLNIQQQQQKKTSKVARLRFAHLFVLPNHFGKVAFECLGFRWVLANVPRFFLAKNCPRFVHCFGFFLEWGNLLNYHDQNLNIGIIKGHGFFFAIPWC